MNKVYSEPLMEALEVSTDRAVVVGSVLHVDVEISDVTAHDFQDGFKDGGFKELNFD